MLKATLSTFKKNKLKQLNQARNEKEINQAFTACALILLLIAGYALFIN